MKLKKIMAIVLTLCALAAGRAAAADIDFNFEIPTIPYPPKIEDVSNSSAVSGSFTVTASITGQMQMKGFCDIEPKTECTASDWYQAADPDVNPNPPTIQKAKVYYYKNDDVAGTASVDMAYDSMLGKFKADVPLAGYISGDDSITYYIVAIDSRGNVASQVPDGNQRPCPSTSSWDATLATPATNSCSYATSYTQCNEYVAGTPGPCSSSYTMGDKNGDVCGEPDPGGVQHVITGPNADKVDILGISAGADGTYVCANVGLKAPPPGVSDPAPIEGYLTIFFNPDIYDPNPGDTHIENAYAITYAPEAAGSDAALVKVLWSGDCVTNPNTANPLDCKLISAVGASEGLKIEYGGGSIKYMVKKSGTGNPLAVPYSLIGNNTKQTIIIGLTGEINLSGGTAFWISDITPGFAFYHTNKQMGCFDCDLPPSCPLISSTLCSVDGTGGTSSECYKSVSQPAQNKCRVNFNRSLDYSFINEYRIYRNTTASTTGAVKISAVAENGSATYSYLDTHTILDGKTYYYFITSYNATAGMETDLSDACRFSCTVEDWVAPEQPVITKAATPPGKEGTCKIDWHMPAVDPSLASFYLSRSDDGGASYTPLNDDNPVGAEPGSLDFTWTDLTATELGKTYKYKVTATDYGGNTATSDPADCTAEDLQAPTRITSLIAMNVIGKLGVKMEWQHATESDLGGYNTYFCKQNNVAVDCRTAESFTQLNPAGLLAANNYQADNDARPETFDSDVDYCFYVDACDNCNAEGTCPSNANAAPNCAGFPPGGAESQLYVKCLPLTEIIETVSPAFPANVSCTAPEAGKSVKIQWDHICHNADGTPFVFYDGTGACILPTALELVGYKVVFGPRGAVPDFSNATSQNTVGVASVNLPAEFTHTNLVNGQEYCYTVYGVDGWNNFSKESAAYPIREVCCKPERSQPPAKPVMNDIDFTSISCTPSWTKVIDDEPITYNVYRCEGTTTQCANNASFGTAIATGITEAQGLSYADFDVTTDNEYQYCVTVEEPSGNESAVVETGDRINCGTCTPWGEAPPVSDVTAAPLTAEGNTGVKLFWNKYDMDEGSGGYYVYRCNTSTCLSKGSPIQSCKTTVPTALSPLIIDGEPAGDWYYGVAYRKDCGDPLTESMVTNRDAAIDGPIHVDSVCTKCIVVSSCADYDANTGCVPVQVIDTSAKGADGKFAASGVAGYEVFLVDSSNNMIGAAATTGSDGNYKLIVGNDDSAVNLSYKYKIVLKVPEANKSGVPCSPGFAGNDCYIVLESAVTVTDDGVNKKVSGLKLPEPGGGRGEIGNPTCDNVVDVQDLLAFKDTFGGNLGDSKYKTYADFDGNGSIDVEDFLILRKNFGKTLDAAPSFDATLCKP